MRRVLIRAFPSFYYSKSGNVRISKSGSIENRTFDKSVVSIGANSLIEGELFAFPRANRLTLGEYCYLGSNSRVWSADSVIIGDRVLIAHNVNIFDSWTHPISAAARHKHFKEILTSGHPEVIDLGARPVVIGPDAWVGAGSTILRGVEIGARSIISAGSVVSCDIPEDSIVAGNPAVVVKRLREDVN